MKNVFFLIWVLLCSLLLNSCFTGKVYHHARVKVEQSPVTAEAKETDCSIKHDGLSLPENHQPQPDSNFYHISQESVSDYSPVINKNTPPPVQNPDKGKDLKKANQIKDRWDDIEGFFFILFFFIVGLPSIALLITGFMFGLAGMMVGFWICWVLGILGIMLLSFASIVAWASGDDNAWVIVSTFFYLLLFLMAIAFILIVLI